MLEIIGELVRTLVLIAMVSVVLDMLVPGEDYRRYLRMVIGLIILLLVIKAVSDVTRREHAEIFAFAGFPLREAEQDIIAREGRRLWELNQHQTLEEYRNMIKGYLSTEINKRGEWELTELELIFSDNLFEEGGEYGFGGYHPQFGQIDLVRAYIARPRESVPGDPGARDGIWITVDEVTPVSIGDYAAEPGQEVPVPEEEIAAVAEDAETLRNHISSILQVPVETVEVVIETYDTGAG